MSTKNIAAVLKWAAQGDPPEELKAAWDELAALSRARAEALEEAATEMDGLAASAKVEGDDDGADAYEVGAEYLRALISTRPPASIPVERVREVLQSLESEAEAERSTEPRSVVDAVTDTLSETARRLGVDLDAKRNNHG